MGFKYAILKALTMCTYL